MYTETCVCMYMCVYDAYTYDCIMYHTDTYIHTNTILYYTLCILYLGKLRSIHFTDTMINSPRSALSGGWKMKLLIVKAMLSKANVSI